MHGVTSRLQEELQKKAVHEERKAAKLRLKADKKAERLARLRKHAAPKAEADKADKADKEISKVHAYVHVHMHTLCRVWHCLTW